MTRLPRYACVDVGSNTTRLLVAEAAPGTIEKLRDERVFTLIGPTPGGGDGISRDKIEEVAGVVSEQVVRAHELGAEQVRAVATAAIRKAANASELVEAVKRRCRVPLEVLSGEAEARLAFRGAVNAAPAGAAGRVAVFDVGGGSTEVAIGRCDGHVEHVCSLPIGSAVLTGRHLRSDPPTAAELDQASAAVATALAATRPSGVAIALTVGGSASSLLRLAGEELDREQLAAAIAAAVAAPAAELAPRHGLDPARMRLLPGALVILSELAACFGRPIRVCQGGLREGVVLEMAEASVNDL